MGQEESIPSHAFQERSWRTTNFKYELATNNYFRVIIGNVKNMCVMGFMAVDFIKKELKTTYVI